MLLHVGFIVECFHADEAYRFHFAHRRLWSYDEGHRRSLRVAGAEQRPWSRNARE